MLFTICLLLKYFLTTAKNLEALIYNVISWPHLLHSFSVATATGKIMSAGLFFQLLASAITFAVFMVGIETSPVKSLLFCVSVQGMTYNMLITYAYCLFSEMISADLAAIGDIFYGCAWYRMPVKQQNRLMLPIQRAQVEFRLYGLGFIECSLKTYTSVKSDLSKIVIFTFSYFVKRLEHFCLILTVLLGTSYFLYCRSYELHGPFSLLCMASNKPNNTEQYASP